MDRTFPTKLHQQYLDLGREYFREGGEEKLAYFFEANGTRKEWEEIIREEIYGEANWLHTGATGEC